MSKKDPSKTVDMYYVPDDNDDAFEEEENDRAALINDRFGDYSPLAPESEPQLPKLEPVPKAEPVEAEPVEAEVEPASKPHPPLT